MVTGPQSSVRPRHLGHCQRPAAFSPVGSPQVAGSNLQMRKARPGKGVPFPGATGSQHTAESIEARTLGVLGAPAVV